MARRRLLTDHERRCLFEPPTDDIAIIANYTLSAEDIEVIGRRYGAPNRLGLASHIALMRHLGFGLPGNKALLQTWGTAARRHPVGGLGSIGEMLIEHNHGFGQGRGSNSECSFNQAHLPHDTWLQAPCLGLSFA